MAEIQLSRGLITIVDDADAGFVNQWKWYAMRHSRTFYAVRCVERPTRRTLLLHRELLGAPDRVPVDHRNLDGLDNRRENIRIATNSGNTANRLKMAGGTSRFKGVSWNPRDQCWRVQIGHARRNLFLGHFDHEIAAARAYDYKALELFGEFALTNATLGLFDTDLSRQALALVEASK